MQDLHLFHGYDLRQTALVLVITFGWFLCIRSIFPSSDKPDKALEDYLFAVIRFIFGLLASLSIFGIFACGVLYLWNVLLWGLQENGFVVLLVLLLIGGLLGLGSPSAGAVVLVIFKRK